MTDSSSPSSIAPAGGSARRPAAALVGLAVCWVVVGGLVAAIARPLDVANGSWIAAYLVLVAGVAQCAMGLDRIWRPTRQRSGWGWAQVGAWNGGGALVIGGTLARAPWIVDAGSALLFAALAIALHAAMVSDGDRVTGNRSSRWIAWGYRALLVALAISIPIGIVLSHTRHS